MSPTTPNHQHGFTLVELLAVVLLILLFASLVVGVAGYAQRRAKESATRAEIAALEAALEAYRADWGYYPLSTTNRYSPYKTASANSAVAQRLNCSRMYRALSGRDVDGNLVGRSYYAFRSERVVSGVLSNQTDFGWIQGGDRRWTWYNDPYGRSYCYYRCDPPLPDQRNPATFDLWSCGPNRESRGPGNNNAGLETDDITNWSR